MAERVDIYICTFCCFCFLFPFSFISEFFSPFPSIGPNDGCKIVPLLSSFIFQQLGKCAPTFTSILIFFSFEKQVFWLVFLRVIWMFDDFKHIHLSGLERRGFHDGKNHHREFFFSMSISGIQLEVFSLKLQCRIICKYFY